MLGWQALEGVIQGEVIRVLAGVVGLGVEEVEVVDLTSSRLGDKT